MLFTIGHSTHTLDAFFALLRLHRIELLADVRSFPASRRLPHFGRHGLSQACETAGIEYRWLAGLGGRRGVQPNAGGNLGLRSLSFRNYADYMLGAEFPAALDELRRLAMEYRVVYVCAEAVYWRCHRRLISDALQALDEEVLHVMPDGKLRAHALTDGARIVARKVSYPGLF